MELELSMSGMGLLFTFVVRLPYVSSRATVNGVDAELPAPALNGLLVMTSWVGVPPLMVSAPFPPASRRRQAALP